MKFQAVCFDLDGTLLDTLADLAYCTNKILSERGFPTHHVDAFRNFVGDGAKMLMTRVLPEEVRNEALIEECKKILRLVIVNAGIDRHFHTKVFLNC